MNPTYFGLLAEFGESEIPLERVCEKYFGLSTPKAKRRACLQQLPIPAYRAGSQKSPWLISAIDLAKHIDEKRVVAARQWVNMKQRFLPSTFTQIGHTMSHSKAVRHEKITTYKPLN